MAIDAIYTIAKIIPDSLKPFKSDIVPVLHEFKFDKMKPVREATVEALGALKGVPDSEVSKNKEKPEFLDSKPAKIEKKSNSRKPRFIENTEQRDLSKGDPF